MHHSFPNTISGGVRQHNYKKRQPFEEVWKHYVKLQCTFGMFDNFELKKSVTTCLRIGIKTRLTCRKTTVSVI